MFANATFGVNSVYEEKLIQLCLSQLPRTNLTRGGRGHCDATFTCGQGLKNLASWLVLHGMNSTDALQLCAQAHDGEFVVFDADRVQSWESIQLPLRSWL